MLPSQWTKIKTKEDLHVLVNSLYCRNLEQNTLMIEVANFSPFQRQISMMHENKRMMAMEGTRTSPESTLTPLQTVSQEMYTSVIRKTYESSSAIPVTAVETSSEPNNRYVYYQWNRIVRNVSLTCTQQRLRSACAFAQSDQRLHCPHEKKNFASLAITKTCLFKYIENFTSKN